MGPVCSQTCTFVLVTIALCYLVVPVVPTGIADCPCSEASLCDPITSHPEKELFAFRYSESGSVDWKRYDWSRITTLAMFGDYDADLMCHAHKMGARVVYKGSFPRANLSSSTDRANWIDDQLRLAKAQHMDGINFDMEYALQQEEAHYLVSLVEETTSAFHKANPYSQVTFDTFFYPGCFAGRCYDYKDLASSCDFLVLMEYNFGGLGPIAKSNDPILNETKAVKAYIAAGIPAEKLVLGVPWYGYAWTCEQLFQNNTCLVPDSPPFMKYLYYSDITKLLKNSTSGRLYNQLYQSPFFNYKDPESGKFNQVWYDDPQSLRIRYQLAKDTNLHGVGMWNADCLDYTGDAEGAILAKAMWDAINTFIGN